MRRRIFFVHVMKTGGASFRRHLEANLGADRVYPDSAVEPDLLIANVSAMPLLEIGDDRWDRIDAVTGHLPFYVSQVLGKPFITLTVLRDPVERTISYLKHCRKYQEQHRGMALEDIYDDPWYYPMLIWNHQVKVFALQPSDGVDTVMEPLLIDQARLDIAKENLRKVDVLGLHDHYDEFLATALERLGWSHLDLPDWHVSEPEDVSDRLRRRIEEDNAMDVAFFDFARELHAARAEG